MRQRDSIAIGAAASTTTSQRAAVVTAVHARELSRSPDPVELLGALRGQPYPWLLDSSLPSPRLGRFSFVGAAPYLVLRCFGTRAEIECRRPVRPDVPSGRRTLEGDPFALARALCPPPPRFVGKTETSLPPFVGGAVGYFGYELVEQLESVRLSGRDDLDLPDLVLLFVDRLVAVDTLVGRAWAIGLGFECDEASARTRAETASRECADEALALAGRSRRRTRSSRLPQRASPPATGSALLDETEHAAAVRAIGEQIAAGNVYQANLTRRIELPLCDADPWELYLQLRWLNPAPFAAYLELPEVAILSSSPERFLGLDCDGRVESRPIKGTRPRGATSASDAALRRELVVSAKDRSENLMIVDLVRNDLGRVCETGSIDVPELMAIESYATVFQMVSTITGRLAPDCDGIDLVRASFPPGSMTGAPKIAAMQILDALEPVRRGVYSGALGYLDVRGGLDLSVVIRTLIVCDGVAHLHVGGGIVADSEPAAEFREMLDKARALLAALAHVKSPPAEPPPTARGGLAVW